jgi:hypothetical protein
MIPLVDGKNQLTNLPNGEFTISEIEVYRVINVTEVFLVSPLDFGAVDVDKNVAIGAALNINENVNVMKKKKDGKFKLIKLIKQFISAPFKNKSKKK